MEKGFLTKIYNLQTLWPCLFAFAFVCVLWAQLVAHAAIPKFLQLTHASAAVVLSPSSLNENLDFIGLEIDCFNVDSTIEEISFKAYGDYLSSYFESFELIDLNTDLVLSRGVLANGWVNFTENFACTSNQTMNVLVVANLTDLVDRDFSFGLKILEQTNVELLQDLLIYAEYPILGPLVEVSYQAPEIVEPEPVVEQILDPIVIEPPEDVVSQEDLALNMEEVIEKMQKILDSQSEAQLDVNEFFVDSLGQIKKEADEIQAAVVERDTGLQQQIDSVLELVEPSNSQVDLTQMVEFLQESVSTKIDQTQLTSTVVKQINKLLPKSQEVVMLDKNNLDLSHVDAEQIDKVLESVADLMQKQVKLEQQIQKNNQLIDSKKIPELGEVQFSDLTLSLADYKFLPFVDLTPATHLFVAVAELYRRAVVKGFTNNFFLADKEISRAETLKILLSLRFGEVGLLPVDIDFVDVQESDWFYKYVVMAVNMDVVTGFDGNEFMPEKAVSMGEFLKMMTLIFNLALDSDSTLVSSFAKDWFAPYLSSIESFNLLENTQIMDLDPKANLTRGEVCIILFNYLSNR
ncbi:hypothetical protein HOH51_02190 [bacterium]|jgi:hypothetical protein|nr:hypothetical protein [bacterium]